MLLEPLLRRNRPFVEAAAELHRAAEIPADSYVLDLDAVRHNVGILQAEADRSGTPHVAGIWTSSGAAADWPQ